VKSSAIFRIRALVAAGGVAILLFTGCAPLMVKTPETAVRYPFTPVSSDEVANAKAVLAINPKDPQAPRARFLIAQNEFNHQEWSKAERFFSDLYKRHPRSEWAPAAELMVARARVRQKKPLFALSALNSLKKSGAFREPALSEAGTSLARQIINDELDLADLAKVRSVYPDSDWSQQALFVTGKRTLDAGQAEQAARVFKQYIELYPDSEYANTAQQLMLKAIQMVPVNRMRIGVILPMSGPYSPFGKAIYRGLELALNQFNQYQSESQKLVLAVEDSEANSESASASLQRLAETEKVFAVIGPALSNSARAILPDLSRFRMPLITPSASISWSIDITRMPCWTASSRIEFRPTASPGLQRIASTPWFIRFSICSI